MFEGLLNGLRLVEGVSLAMLSERTGAPEQTIQNRLRPLQQQRLLVTQPGRVACTPLGLRHLNTLLERLATP